MRYYTPPDKFDEDLDKPEFRALERLRRRQSAFGAIVLLAVLALVAWFVLRGRVWLSSALRTGPAQESEETGRGSLTVPGLEAELPEDSF